MKNLLTPVKGKHVHLKKSNNEEAVGILTHVHSDYVTMYTDEGNFIHYPLWNLVSVISDIRDISQAPCLSGISFPRTFYELISSLTWKMVSIENGDGALKGVILEVTPQGIVLVIDKQKVAHYYHDQIGSISPVFRRAGESQDDDDEKDEPCPKPPKDGDSNADSEDVNLVQDDQWDNWENESQDNGEEEWEKGEWENANEELETQNDEEEVMAFSIMKNILTPAIGKHVHLSRENNETIAGVLTHVHTDYATLYNDEGEIVHYPYWNLNPDINDIQEASQASSLPELSLPSTFYELISTLDKKMVTVRCKNGALKGLLVEVTPEGIVLVDDRQAIANYFLYDIQSVTPVYRRAGERQDNDEYEDDEHWTTHPGYELDEEDDDYDPELDDEWELEDEEDTGSRSIVPRYDGITRRFNTRPAASVSRQSFVRTGDYAAGRTVSQSNGGTIGRTGGYTKRRTASRTKQTVSRTLDRVAAQNTKQTLSRIINRVVDRDPKQNVGRSIYRTAAHTTKQTANRTTERGAVHTTKRTVAQASNRTSGHTTKRAANHTSQSAKRTADGIAELSAGLSSNRDKTSVLTVFRPNKVTRGASQQLKQALQVKSKMV